MNPESINVIDIPGQIYATEHLMSVATDIMNSTNERYNNDTRGKWTAVPFTTFS